MQKHTKIFMDYFGFGITDFVPCEIHNGGDDGQDEVKRCVDVHHLDGRGKGMDEIKRLAGLCRECHIMAGKDKSFNEHVRKVHLIHVERGWINC
jgi:hypothetical protein